MIFLVHQIFLTFDLHKEICLFFSLRRRTLPWYDLSLLKDLAKRRTRTERVLLESAVEAEE